MQPPTGVTSYYEWIFPVTFPGRPWLSIGMTGAGFTQSTFSYPLYYLWADETNSGSAGYSNEFNSKARFFYPSKTLNGWNGAIVIGY